MGIVRHLDVVGLWQFLKLLYTKKQPYFSGNDKQHDEIPWGLVIELDTFLCRYILSGAVNMVFLHLHKQIAFSIYSVSFFSFMMVIIALRGQIF